MPFAFDTGFGDTDPYMSFGAGSVMPVYTDVSRGAPNEQPWTSTGNGTGVFIDQSAQNSLFGGLQTVLNYALLRDQQKMTRVANAPVQAAQAQAQVQQAATSNLLLYALIGGALLFVVLRK